MSTAVQELTQAYTEELRGFLRGAGEQALRRAYELGRRAISENLGVLEMSAIHDGALGALLDGVSEPAELQQLTTRASVFFAESLSPFEMAFRGFQEANASLRRTIDNLSETNTKLADAHHAVESERRRYRELFEWAPDGYVVTEPDGRIEQANSAAASLFQADKDELAGQPLLAFVAEEEHHAFNHQLQLLSRGAMDSAQEWETRIRTSRGTQLQVAIAVTAVRDEHGKRLGLRWLVRDITERKRVEEERNQLRIREQVARAEAEGARRLTFLGEASTMLAASLDYETTLASLARLTVPYVADWCFVYIKEEDETVRQLTVAQANPERTELAERLQRSYGSESAPPERVAQVLETGNSEIVTAVAEVWPVESGSDEQLLALRNVFNSAMIVPLKARGRTLGAMTFFAGESNRRYGPVDLVMAEELAGRCALAVDNARLYRQVIIERDKAEKASRAKDEFVAILSHELRNPLMPILGWARVFKNQNVLMQDSVLSEGVKSLERNAQTVAKLVEDCLDLARISQRKITLERRLLDLNEVVEASIDSVSERAESKGLKLVVHLAPSGLWLLGDRTRLTQAVMNLLTNAVRYTETGGIINVRTARAEAEAEVEVKDTGIGIASDFLDHIFEPFRQGTSSWLTQESGLGLGLAIVKQIVQAHGGRILAESKGPGYGSTFRMRLPLTVTAPLAGPVEETQPIAGAEGPATPLRILFIEDSPDILNLMKMELENMGYSVVTAPDGEAGLQAATREHPDLIVSDIKLPGIDGYELIRRIRQIPGMATVPAIAMTGFGMQRDIEEAMQAGYNAHLTKPVDTEELNAVIRKLASSVTQPVK